MQVCSTEFLFHTLLEPRTTSLESILASGLRPLSDFPDSPRWQLIESKLPGFFEELYASAAEPVIRRPYENSGVFLSPIDFRLLPDSLLHKRSRIRIPVSRIDRRYAALTYVLHDRRISLAVTPENLDHAAGIWTEAMVRRWFAHDPTRMFYYVPQVAVYQKGGIPVAPGDIEHFALK